MKHRALLQSNRFAMQTAASKPMVSDLRIALLLLREPASSSIPDCSLQSYSDDSLNKFNFKYQ